MDYVVEFLNSSDVIANYVHVLSSERCPNIVTSAEDIEVAMRQPWFLIGPCLLVSHSCRLTHSDKSATVMLEMVWIVESTL